MGLEGARRAVERALRILERLWEVTAHQMVSRCGQERAVPWRTEAADGDGSWQVQGTRGQGRMSRV